MEKITENANNLAKELVSTADVASYIQVVNPTTGKVNNIKISDLASVVAAVNVQSNIDLTSGGIYESVDLGLPSGTLWAKYNVGSTSETDYGDLFAWGATEPYRLNGETPIDNTDNYAASYSNTIQRDLYPNEDAATVKWGKGWCMPTKAQLDELYAHTTYAWTTISGVKGGKCIAPNGNYIFFPAVGYMDGGSLINRGSGSNIWSRSFFSTTGAWRLRFDSSSRTVSITNKYYGVSVRPVRAQ